MLISTAIHRKLSKVLFSFIFHQRHRERGSMKAHVPQLQSEAASVKFKTKSIRGGLGGGWGGMDETGTCMYMHTYIHTYIHIHTYTYIHVHACTYMHAYIHTYIYIHTCTCIHTYMYMHTYIHVHACIHTYIHAYIHAYIHTYIHVHACIHTYIHVHACTCMYRLTYYTHHTISLFLTTGGRRHWSND